MQTGARGGITDIKEPTFTTESHRDADTIVVTMSGNADTVVADRLKIFLDELHSSAGVYGIKEAVFVLQELYFMNSSCLSLFLRLINVMLESRAQHKYVLRFRSNPKLRWQKKSLQAI